MIKVCRELKDRTISLFETMFSKDQRKLTLSFLSRRIALGVDNATNDIGYLQQCTITGGGFSLYARDFPQCRYFALHKTVYVIRGCIKIAMSI
jgi:hypothetical protein